MPLQEQSQRIVPLVDDLPVDVIQWLDRTHQIMERRELTPDNAKKLLGFAFPEFICFLHMLGIWFDKFVQSNDCELHLRPIDGAFARARKEHTHFVRLSESEGRVDGIMDEICEQMAYLNYVLMTVDVNRESSHHHEILKSILKHCIPFIRHLLHKLEIYSVSESFHSPTLSNTGSKKAFSSPDIESSGEKSQLNDYFLVTKNYLQLFMDKYSLAHFAEEEPMEIECMDSDDDTKSINNTVCPIGSYSSLLDTKKVTGTPINGLPNIGNSCWFNSFIQAIKPVIKPRPEMFGRCQFQFSDLTCYIMRVAETVHLSDCIASCVTLFYLRLVMHQIYLKFGWRPGELGDAGKFFEILLDLNDFRFALTQFEASPVVEVVFESFCNKCHHSVERCTRFNIIVVKCFKKDDCIDTLINRFIEDLDPKIVCYSCGARCDHVKTRLSFLPKLLVVRIERAARYKKITTDVDISKPLVANFKGKITSFCLRSAVCHAGDKADNGHYKAYAVNSSNGSAIWCKCDDAHVSQCQFDDVEKDAKKNAVILVFQVSNEQ